MHTHFTHDDGETEGRRQERTAIESINFVTMGGRDGKIEARCLHVLLESIEIRGDIYKMIIISHLIKYYHEMLSKVAP